MAARVVSPAECERLYRRLHWGEYGGEPPAPVGCADPREGSASVLGELVDVVYLTIKGGDAAPTEYHHRFRRERPLLLVSAVSRRIIVGGGDYTVNERGIVG